MLFFFPIFFCCIYVSCCIDASLSLNTSVCISWKQEHSFTKPECNDQNQEISIETILVHRIYSVLSWMSFIQNKNYFLIQNPIQDHTLHLLVVSVVSFNLDWLLILPLSSKSLTSGKNISQLFCRIFNSLGLLFPSWFDSGLVLLAGHHM